MIRAPAGVAAALAAAVAACGPSTRTPEPPGPPRPWTWTASTGGPWRLPGRGLDTAIAPDDGHAIVTTGARSIAVIDVATGAVTAAVDVVPEPGMMESMVRAGDRVLAFGHVGNAPAAWSLTAVPPTATPVPLSDTAPPPGSADATRPDAVVSPDGARILVCGYKHQPVVRDAVSLAVLQVVGASGPCRRPVFTDNDHVVYRDRTTSVVELATGVVTQLTSKDPVTYSGPGGRSVTVTAYNNWTLVDRAGTPTQVKGGGVPRWLDDGSAVIGDGLGTLIVVPTNGVRPRTIALPIDVASNHLAITSGGVAILVDGYIAIAADLSTGTIRTVDGNVGPPRAVAPRDGMVIAATDRIRAWRDGALLANGDAGVVGFAADPPDAPVLTIGRDVVGEWEPATGNRRVVHELAETGSMIARAGDRVVFDDGATVMRRKRGEPPAAWFRFRDDLMLAGLDAASGRVAWYREDAFFVADINHGPVFTFCSNAMAIEFAPGAARIAAFDGVGVDVYDLDVKAAPVRVEIEDGSLYAAAFIGASGDLAIAGDHELIVWSATTGAAVSWDTGDDRDVASIGVDAAGIEIAVGYDDGGVRWATIAGIRARAHPRAVVVSAPAPGTCTLPRSPVLDDITVQADADAGGDDDASGAGPDEVECDDSNDNPDDDCSVIYGTPSP